jgi:hypothetical protein
MFHVTQVWLTFDPVFSSTSTNLYSATMHLNPLYPGRGAADPEDMGVIVLDSPVVGITSAALPTLGLLDGMQQAAAFAIPCSLLSATGPPTHYSVEALPMPTKAKTLADTPLKASSPSTKT